MTGPPAPSVRTYRLASALYVALFLGLTSPYWALGEVVAPYRPTIEVAGFDSGEPSHLENRKFGDYVNAFIPEIGALLNGSRSGWLALWLSDNELGRPLYHGSGLSPAYPPSWLFAQLTGNPYWFVTILSVSTCFLAGLFTLLTCRELGLSPLAGLIAGGSYAASPFFMYWLTFPMFLAVWCWSAGALYGVTALFRKPGLPAWSLLAFSIFSLLMTAYAQPVIFHAYILLGYGTYLVGKSWRTGSRRLVLRRVLLAGGAVVVGAGLALPTFLDLAGIASESARIAPDPSFFTAVLPKIESALSALRLVVLGTFPEIFGNPVSPSFPLPYDGLSLTPLVIFLACFALLTRFRATWGWWLAIAVLCLLAFVQPLYILGVKYLGLNLSRSTPMGSIMLPLTMIIAFGADAFTTRQAADFRPAVLLATAGTLFALAAAVAFGLIQGLEIHWSAVAAALLVVGLLFAQFPKPRPVLLVAALIVVGGGISFPLMLRQNPSEMVITTDLVEKVRSLTASGGRYAVAAAGVTALPANFNATVGLASLHSYNSLSPRRYHSLIAALGGELQNYGRQNASIAPDYGGLPFWMSDTSVVLSLMRLDHVNLGFVSEIGGVSLYRVRSRMGCCLQLQLPAQWTPAAAEIDDPRGNDMSRPRISLDKGDVLELDIQKRPTPSLLVLSRKFHRNWRAEATTDAGWIEAETVPVNAVFQGVVLPAEATAVRLQFVPYVRHAWVAHIFWLGILLLWVLRACRSSFRSVRTGDGLPVS